MEYNFLQLNIKRSWAAKSLLDQNMAENNLAIAIISEPPQIKESGDWLISKDGLAAIHWNQDLTTCVLVEKGIDYVIVEMMGVHIVSYYGSPNKKAREFEASLLRLQGSLNKHRNARILLAGDFNARSEVWEDKKNNVRGQILIDWAEYYDYRIINKGTIPTFSSDIGESIIDLTLASPGLMNSIKKKLESSSTHGNPF